MTGVALKTKVYLEIVRLFGFTQMPTMWCSQMPPQGIAEYCALLIEFRVKGLSNKSYKGKYDYVLVKYEEEEKRKTF